MEVVSTSAVTSGASVQLSSQLSALRQTIFVVKMLSKLQDLLDLDAAVLVACRLFLDNLGSILSGEAQKTAQPQDESQVSRADKIGKKEGRISWDKSAEQLHNQVRSFIHSPVCAVILLFLRFFLPAFLRLFIRFFAFISLKTCCKHSVSPACKP